MAGGKPNKFTKEMQDRIIAWVELNGLYPQPCGATVRSLCEACGFSDESWKRWTEDVRNVEFVARLACAREKFAATVEVDVVNALVKAAKGVDFTHIKEEAKADVITDYDPETGKKLRTRTGELKTVKASRISQYYPPNVEAAKFLLSNIASDRWRMKQEIAQSGSVENRIIVESEEQKEKLENIGDAV